jgi:hypothetical protein
MPRKKMIGNELKKFVIDRAHTESAKIFRTKLAQFIAPIMNPRPSPGPARLRRSASCIRCLRLRQVQVKSLRCPLKFIKPASQYRVRRPIQTQWTFRRISKQLSHYFSPWSWPHRNLPWPSRRIVKARWTSSGHSGTNNLRLNRNAVADKADTDEEPNHPGTARLYGLGLSPLSVKQKRRAI